MPPFRRRLDTVLAPDFLLDLEQLSLEDLRERRRLAEEEEVEQSYIRRVLQGKLDLLQAELRVRAGEAHSLIESLPEVLGSDGPRGQSGRLPRYMAPGAHPWGRRDGDDLVTDDVLTRLEQISSEEVESLVIALREQEQQVSVLRRRLHAVIDGIKAEVTRRYASGEASIDELLGGSRAD